MWKGEKNAESEQEKYERKSIQINKAQRKRRAEKRNNKLINTKLNNSIASEVCFVHIAGVWCFAYLPGDTAFIQYSCVILQVPQEIPPKTHNVHILIRRTFGHMQVHCIFHFKPSGLKFKLTGTFLKSDLETFQTQHVVALVTNFSNFTSMSH
jgi:hypothetical protein